MTKFSSSKIPLQHHRQKQRRTPLVFILLCTLLTSDTAEMTRPIASAGIENDNNAPVSIHDDDGGGAKKNRLQQHQPAEGSDEARALEHCSSNRDGSDCRARTFDPNDDNVADDVHLQVLNKFTTSQGHALIELLGPKHVEDCLPLIIAVGHGGKLKPSYIQNRSKDHAHCNKHTRNTKRNVCSTLSDLYTDEIAEKLAKQLTEDTNGRKVPYIVVCNLHRSKLDVNRPIDIAAQGDPIAEQAWYAYHNFIQEAQLQVMGVYGTVQGGIVDRSSIVQGIPGLLIDIHGYGSKSYNSLEQLPPFIHWGYGLKRDDFRDQKGLDANKSTIFALASSTSHPSHDINSLIRGKFSLGSRFYSRFRGVSVSKYDNKLAKHENLLGIGVPSAECPDPDIWTNDPKWCDLQNRNANTINVKCPYFSGGFTTIAHTHLDWEHHQQRQGNDVNNSNQNQPSIRMSTLQIEIPKQIRWGITENSTNMSGKRNRERMHADFVDALSKSLIDFICDFFFVDDDKLTRMKRACHTKQNVDVCVDEAVPSFEKTMHKSKL